MRHPIKYSLFKNIEYFINSVELRLYIWDLGVCATQNSAQVHFLANDTTNLRYSEITHWSLIYEVYNESIEVYIIY